MKDNCQQTLYPLSSTPQHTPCYINLLLFSALYIFVFKFTQKISMLISIIMLNKANNTMPCRKPGNAWLAYLIDNHILIEFTG